MGGADLSQILTSPDTTEASYGGNFKTLKKSSSGMKEQSDSFSTVITARIASDVNDLKASVRRPNAPQGNNTDQALSTAFDAKKSPQSSIRDIAVSKTDAQRAAKLSEKKSQTGTKTDNIATDKVSKALDDFKGKVNTVIRDALGVSDQDIENAMEELGLAYTDLSDPSALRDLLMMLTGAEDPSQLLSMDGVSSVKGGIAELFTTLLQDTGLDIETIKSIDNELFTDTFSAADVDSGLQGAADGTVEDDSLKVRTQPADEKETGAKASSGMEEGVSTDITYAAEPSETGQTQTAAAAQTGAAASPEDASSAQNTNTSSMEAVARTDERPETGNERASADISGNDRPQTVLNETAAVSTQDDDTSDELSADDEDESASDGLLSGRQTGGEENAVSEEPVSTAPEMKTGRTGEQTRQAAPGMHEQTAVGNTDIQNPLNTQATPATEQVQPAAPYSTQNYNISDIVRQMATGVRTALQGGLTSLEMQLNPENLGRMILRVTEQDGQVTAHINLQNENVKTAMESQMALIRQNLEAQGIRVTEVTVTADAHEFERNLEEGQGPDNFDLSNTEGDRQTDGEDGRGRTRNIDMREFESGDVDVNDLSESERLQAQIMRENGNTLNLNA